MEQLFYLILIDQLLILDNVISESIVRIIMHREYKDVSCVTAENDILAALTQFLSWVRTTYLMYIKRNYVLIPCLSPYVVAHVCRSFG